MTAFQPRHERKPETPVTNDRKERSLTGDAETGDIRSGKAVDAIEAFELAARDIDRRRDLSTDDALAEIMDQIERVLTSADFDHRDYLASIITALDMKAATAGPVSSEGGRRETSFLISAIARLVDRRNRLIGN